MVDNKNDRRSSKMNDERMESKEISRAGAAPAPNPIPGHRYFQTVVNQKPGGKKASIYVKGLSIMCPSRNNRAIDIGFIKDDHKPVEIDVFGPQCSRVARFVCPQNVRVRIEIQKTGAVGATDPGKKYKPGGLHSGDCDWIPDLTSSQWHGNDPIAPLSGAPDHLSAILVLRDGIFFTHKQGKSKAKQTRFRNGTKVPAPPPNPALIDTPGLVLGADIEEPPGNNEGFTISVFAKYSPSQGEKIIMFAYLPKDGGPYEISVGTEADGHGHTADPLDWIYTVVGSVGSDKITFKMKYEDPEGEFHLCPEPGLKLGTTEYACQTYGGGGGPLPDFP